MESKQLFLCFLWKVLEVLVIFAEQVYDKFQINACVIKMTNRWAASFFLTTYLWCFVFLEQFLVYVFLFFCSWVLLLIRWHEILRLHCLLAGGPQNQFCLLQLPNQVVVLRVFKAFACFKFAFKEFPLGPSILIFCVFKISGLSIAGFFGLDRPWLLQTANLVLLILKRRLFRRMDLSNFSFCCVDHVCKDIPNSNNWF